MVSALTLLSSLHIPKQMALVTIIHVLYLLHRSSAM
jgi:hypothetical protein